MFPVNKYYSREKMRIHSVMLGLFCFVRLVSICHADDGGDAQLTIRKNFNRLIETKSCRSCDLSGLDLKRLDLSGADLEGANLAGAQLFLANLSGANLRNSDLQGVGLGGADLAGADLRGANLTGAVLAGAYLTGAMLDGGLDLSSGKRSIPEKPLSTSPQPGRGDVAPVEKKHEVVVVRKRRDFEHAPSRLSDYFAEQAPKEGEPKNEEVQPVEAKEQVQQPFQKVTSTGNGMENAKKLFVVADDVTDFEGRVVLGEKRRAMGDNTDTESGRLIEMLKEENRCVACELSGANLSNLDLRGADLERANLSGTNLQEVDLRDVNLKGANLRQADLRGADLRGGDLYKADLSFADLTGAQLTGALLDSAELLGAKGISVGMFSGGE